jgi:hypothetical protein
VLPLVNLPVLLPVLVVLVMVRNILPWFFFLIIVY